MNKQSHENNLNKDVLKYLPVKILPAFSGLLTIYLLTRTLSMSLYSNYAFLTAIILLFGQLISGWINSSVIFFYPEYAVNNSLDALKLNVIALQLMLYVIGAIGFAITCYIGLEDFSIILIGLLLLLSQTFLNLLYSFLQAERRVFVQIQSTSIQSVIQIIGLSICFYYYKENLYFVMGVLFLSYFVASNYVMYCDKIYGLILDKRSFSFLDFSIGKKILFYGLPVCVWFFASQFYAIGDRVLFKYFNIHNLVGNYAAFRDLSVGLSGFITMPLLMASHPIIVQMWKTNVDIAEIEKVLTQNIKLLLTFFTPIFIGIFLVGDWVLTQVVGLEYLLDNNLMFLVVFSIFFGTVSMYLHKGLEVTGRTMLMAKIALTVAFLSLILNIFFIPMYGVKAAVLISVASQIIYCAAVYHFSKEIICIKISYIFIYKNLFLILCAWFISNYILITDTFLVIRVCILLISAIYVLLSSKELKEMVQTIL
ncbi:oligosaccharide flippase family protein [Flavobacterium galactosidilyticum]|uniref:oligosaccharide flippase family protein n=1 Tax=Flavobacterium galactosidilyticum TaxID=2893886 RepID=UPI001E42EF28|nr:oligosaccharide flippase family protein [Flavobacterium sp. F-340]UFH46685.1 oligosaccharide flippase family protein [Flavobacterium sp. F-340]